jgi:hypothetical protein
MLQPTKETIHERAKKAKLDHSTTFDTDAIVEEADWITTVFIGEWRLRLTEVQAWLG